MKKKLPSWLSVLFLTVVLIIPGLVFAGNDIIKKNASPLDRLNNAATNYGPFSETATETSAATIIGLVVNVVLGILGVIFLVLTILAGIKWMTAGGNDAKVKEAQGSITKAVTGLLIIISSYAIWMFIQVSFLSKL
ncbi:MAG: hypothetical protein PHN91_00310 [Patescibacteria group bacterium]|nr:hypothetical protein [Patescibacteria group bacterium]MDD3435261.1 hypothetical protein [Patescibacteria group bacterium]MDD4466249.1 hypothetical protein [Patescibacteria group bacterium]